MLSNEYVAGFFDGEGCVNITVRGKIRQVALRVTIVNTDAAILQELFETFGGTLTRPRSSNSRWKLFRAIEWRGKYAISFLEKIQPFVTVKRPQIELAFEFWKFMQLPKTERCVVVCAPVVGLNGRTHLTRSEATKIRELEFKARMHRLNMKGRLVA